MTRDRLALRIALAALREITGFFNPLNPAATMRAQTAEKALEEIKALPKEGK